MFQFPTFAPRPICIQGRVPHLRWVSPFGHPRIAACLPAPRGFSQVTTSFIASGRQDIHRVPLSDRTNRTPRPSRPRGAHRPTAPTRQTTPIDQSLRFHLPALVAWLTTTMSSRTQRASSTPKWLASYRNTVACVPLETFARDHLRPRSANQLALEERRYAEEDVVLYPVFKDPTRQHSRRNGSRPAYLTFIRLMGAAGG